MLKVFLIRHAHREITDRSADNGLSEKGRDQAKQLAQYFASRLESQLCHSYLFSSPKRRCQETLQELAAQAKKEIVVLEDLEEQRRDEDSRAFTTRLQTVMNDWSLNFQDKTILACSHGDWIPEALYQLCNIKSDIRKAGWAELHYDAENSWTLQDLAESASQKYQ